MTNIEWWMNRWWRDIETVPRSHRFHCFVESCCVWIFWRVHQRKETTIQGGLQLWEKIWIKVWSKIEFYLRKKIA